MMDAALFNGRGASELAVGFDLTGVYGDGFNLYEYLGSNPWMRADPMGLSWDPFDMVDEYLAETAGQKAALLAQLGQSAKAAAVVAATITSMLPSPLAGYVGDIALYKLGAQSEEELLFGIAMGLILGGKLVAKLGDLGKPLGRLLGRVGSAAWSATKRFVKDHGRSVLRAGFGVAGWLADKAIDFVRRKPPAACHCFTAGTMVLTPAGALPIADVRVGEEILAAPDSGHGLDAHAAEVTDTAVPRLAALTLLKVSNNDGIVEIIETTDEHPFHHNGTWTRTDSLSPGDDLSTVRGSATVVSIEFTSRQAMVYDLVVSGPATYYVGDSGLWAHNCSSVLRFEVPSFNTGMSEALDWLRRHGASDLTASKPGRFPVSHRGRPVGMQTADGKAHWRLEWDETSGMHINVQADKEKGPHIILRNGSEADRDAILRQLFPDSW